MDSNHWRKRAEYSPASSSSSSSSDLRPPLHHPTPPQSSPGRPALPPGLATHHPLPGTPSQKTPLANHPTASVAPAQPAATAAQSSRSRPTSSSSSHSSSPAVHPQNQRSTGQKPAPPRNPPASASASSRSSQPSQKTQQAAASSTSAVTPAPAAPSQTNTPRPTSPKWRYRRSTLLALRESPLVKRPEGLPSIDSLIGEKGRRPSSEAAEAAATATAAAGNVRVAGERKTSGGPAAATLASPSVLGKEKPIVFGPPKMSFASSQQSSGPPKADEPSSVTKPSPRSFEFPRAPKPLAAERIAAKREGSMSVQRSASISIGSGAEKADVAIGSGTGLGSHAKLSTSPEASSSDRAARQEWRDRDHSARENGRPGSGASDRVRERDPRRDWGGDRGGERERNGTDRDSLPRRRDDNSWRDDSARGPRASLDNGPSSRMHQSSDRRRNYNPEWYDADVAPRRVETIPTPVGGDIMPRFRAEQRVMEAMRLAASGASVSGSVPALPDGAPRDGSGGSLPLSQLPLDATRDRTRSVPKPDLPVDSMFGPQGDLGFDAAIEHSSMFLFDDLTNPLALVSPTVASPGGQLGSAAASSSQPARPARKSASKSRFQHIFAEDGGASNADEGTSPSSGVGSPNTTFPTDPAHQQQHDYQLRGGLPSYAISSSAPPATTLQSSGVPEQQQFSDPIARLAADLNLRSGNATPPVDRFGRLQLHPDHQQHQPPYPRMLSEAEVLATIVPPGHRMMSEEDALRAMGMAPMPRSEDRPGGGSGESGRSKEDGAGNLSHVFAMLSRSAGGPAPPQQSQQQEDMDLGPQHPQHPQHMQHPQHPQHLQHPHHPLPPHPHHTLLPPHPHTLPPHHPLHPNNLSPEAFYRLNGPPLQQMVNPSSSGPHNAFGPGPPPPSHMGMSMQQQQQQHQSPPLSSTPPTNGNHSLASPAQSVPGRSEYADMVNMNMGGAGMAAGDDPLAALVRNSIDAKRGGGQNGGVGGPDRFGKDGVGMGPPPLMFPGFNQHITGVRPVSFFNSRGKTHRIRCASVLIDLLNPRYWQMQPPPPFPLHGHPHGPPPHHPYLGAPPHLAMLQMHPGMGPPPPTPGMMGMGGPPPMMGRQGPPPPGSPGAGMRGGGYPPNVNGMYGNMPGPVLKAEEKR
ncbi:hypothetical protein BDK51DRAFT_43540 [Blyttiomyces helicus]|uniref:Uncharacterized protein n=1 Tax=Blyttiomyces helicus TaxID=388810 RepID=A0A4P9WIL8_9FUNG|nr:hypothetical protein BDK51DRAFT_43540 [Blyttiomyces helicus]|eukprot:RKO91288.1 hypothetical protein BDK51DRAFT_43540 [Blyttiomyces helicus]